jgi:hypothetical protein
MKQPRERVKIGHIARKKHSITSAGLIKPIAQWTSSYEDGSNIKCDIETNFNIT